MKAQEWGVANVYVYRSGIIDWLKKYPDQVLFNGQEFAGDPAEYLLDSEKYLARCLSPQEFVAQSGEPSTVVFDIRDVAGRQKFPIKLVGIKHYPVDRVVKLVRSGSRKISRKRLLILDGCGTQAKWLQYVLEEAGVENYFFLEGGVLNWRRVGLDHTGQMQGQ